MFRRHLIAAALGLAAIVLASCGQGGGKPDLPVLKVGSQKGGTKALILASGVLEGAPYRVEWSEFPAAQHLLEAVGAGAVDLGAVGDAPFLFAFASGGKVKAVHASRATSGGGSTALLVRKDSPIHDLAGLRGRKVATGRGSIGHYLLLRLLEKAGLSPSDVQIVYLSPGDAKAAFASGAIDAWVTWGSYIYLAQLTDGAQVLADGRGVLSGYGFEVANTQSIGAKRAQIEDFLGRLSRAQRWVADHKPEYAAALAKETGLDPKIAALTVANARSEPVLIDATVIAEEKTVLERFQAAGAIAAHPDIAQGFDTSFSAAVAR